MRSSVISEAIIEAAGLLGIQDRALADAIGVSPSMISKLRHQKATLKEGKHPFEMATSLIRIYRSLAAIVGHQEEHLRGWFNANNTDLGGVPADLVRSPQGLFTTLNYLDSQRSIC